MQQRKGEEWKFFAFLEILRQIVLKKYSRCCEGEEKNAFDRKNLHEIEKKLKREEKVGGKSFKIS